MSAHLPSLPNFGSGGTFHVPARCVAVSSPRRQSQMMKIGFAVAAAAAVLMTAPSLVSTTPAKAQTLNMGQRVDGQRGRDRHDRARRRRNDSDVTIRVGPRGVTV